MTLLLAETVVCSRNWGVRQSLVMTTLSGSALLDCGELGFSGSGVSIEALRRSATEADVAIEIAVDASVGPLSLLVSVRGQLFEFQDVFTVVASTLSSSSGPTARGIGSTLL